MRPSGQAITTFRSGYLNRLGANYGGRIFPERTENTDLGRNAGFSGQQAGPDVSGRQQAFFATGILPQVLDDLVQRGLHSVRLVQRVQELAQRIPGLVALNDGAQQGVVRIGVLVHSDTNGPGRGALAGKGLQCLQGGTVFRGES